MKLSALLILFTIMFGPVFSQVREHLVTETYYYKWKVTYQKKEFYVNVHKSDKQDTGRGGITTLYFPMTMIDDGIFGSLGIVFSKEKKPEYVFELSFPMGIGNKSYENLSRPDIDMTVWLMSGKDTILTAVSYQSVEDEITIKGVQFKSRLYRFMIPDEDLKKMESYVLDRLQINFKSKSNKLTGKNLPVAGDIVSKNGMIRKFSTFANSIERVSISEIK